MIKKTIFLAKTLRVDLVDKKNFDLIMTMQRFGSKKIKKFKFKECFF